MVSQQCSVCPARGSCPATVVTHQCRSGRRAGRSRRGWRPHRRCHLGSRHWSPSGSGSCSPSPGLRGLALLAVEARVRPGLTGSRARVRAEVKRKWSAEGRGVGDTVLGPLRGQGLGKGPRGFRMQRRVPYAAAQLAPAEFGLWVAACVADQPDFISFPPAALRLGLSLLCP